MRRTWLCAVFIVIAASASMAKVTAAKKQPPAPAQPQQPAIVGDIQNAETVHVRVGSGNVLTFPSRVVRVAVGDDKVVALHVVESRQVLLQGLMPGRSTVFAWLADGRRLRYDLVVSPRVEVLEQALHNLDPRIVVDANGDSSTLILSGKVDDERVANEARQLAENMLGTSAAAGSSRVVSLLQFPGSNEADLRLTSALAAVDPRIHLRRMQVGAKVSNAADAVVLEGRVKDIPALVRAITLAELQLGGVGGKIQPLDGEALQSGRNRNFSGSSGLQRLQGSDGPPSGLAAYIARGLILKSASGRVLSFLEVDELPQIMVSIRVLQVDRGRAKHLGIDYRLDGSGFSAGSFQQPGRTTLPAPPPPSAVQSITGLAGGNVLATFVDKTLAVAAAIDFLQEKDLARSVAEPNITTLSGESASVLIGGEVPIPTTTVGTTTSVQGFLFQDFGVRLDIRPTLAPSGLVAMEISPSIIRPSADLAVSGVPGFQVQSVQTTAKVAPGQTLVLGGLISFDDEIQKRGVPGLSEIPLMKHLFSWEGRTLTEQEILFVITPRILTEGPQQLADAIQWRDVEPIAAGSFIELPPADLDHITNPSKATLGKDGLPPAFGKSAPGSTNPGDAEMTPPPPPPRPSRRSSSTVPPVKEPLATPEPAPPEIDIIPPQTAPVVYESALPPVKEAAPPVVTESASTPVKRAPSTPAKDSAPLVIQDSPSPLVKEPVAAPVKNASSTPVKDSAPLPVKQPAPPVVKESSPTPMKSSSSTPVKDSTPLQVKDSAPPAVKESVTTPMKSSSSTPVKDSPPPPVKDSATPFVKEPASTPVKSAWSQSAKDSAPLAVKESAPPVVKESVSTPVKSASTTPVKDSASVPVKESVSTPVKNASFTSAKEQAALPLKDSSPPVKESAKKSEPAPAHEVPSSPKPDVKTASVPLQQSPPDFHPASPAVVPSPAALASQPVKSTPSPVRRTTPIATVKVNDELKASLTRDHQIEVIASPHEGDAWSRLAKRLTGNARNWKELARFNGADETLTSEARVHVPFEMLRPELKQEIIDKLLPKGSAAESDWKGLAAHP